MWPWAQYRGIKLITHAMCCVHPTIVNLHGQICFHLHLMQVLYSNFCCECPLGAGALLPWQRVARMWREKPYSPKKAYRAQCCNDNYYLLIAKAAREYSQYTAAQKRLPGLWCVGAAPSAPPPRSPNKVRVASGLPGCLGGPGGRWAPRAPISGRLALVVVCCLAAASL